MHIDLYRLRSVPHLNQLFTGFRMLERQGLITLNVIRTGKPVFNEAGLPILRVRVDDCLDLIYDTLDGYRFDHTCSTAGNVRLLDEVLGTCDLYFKRSFSRELNQGLGRTNIFPLGLNYNVDNELDSGFSDVKPLSREFFRLLIRRNRLTAKLADVEYYKDLRAEQLCAPPQLRNSYVYPGSVLLLTRPWDPFGQELPQDLIDERMHINEFRAACIRACRREFGKNFVGGFTDSAYARSLYPDLVVNKSLTGKANYLGMMRQASICVATTGLHNSIGWKFGEYVSHAKAIVSEPLHYSLPGSFTFPQNYRPFDSVDGLVGQITQLLHQPEQVTAMMRANHDYYTNWVRPDKLILNTLETARATTPV